MKRIYIAAAVTAFALLLSGCGKNAASNLDFSMPDSPKEFVVTTFTDPNDESVNYAALEFDGKTYVKYGTLSGEIDKKDVGSCLGYLVEDGHQIQELRVFDLASDPEQNYLLTMDSQGIMENPSFFRNIETVGEDIETPSFIEDADYALWK